MSKGCCPEAPLRWRLGSLQINIPLFSGGIVLLALIVNYLLCISIYCEFGYCTCVTVMSKLLWMGMYGVKVLDWFVSLILSLSFCLLFILTVFRAVENWSLEEEGGATVEFIVLRRQVG